MHEQSVALIVEDRKEDRFFLRRAISVAKPHWSILEFTYADEALKFLTSQECPPIGVVFVDINMPRMDGFEFMDDFTKISARAIEGTSVWVMTSSINPDDRVWAENHPSVDGFVEKPVTIEFLKGLVPAPSQAKSVEVI